MSARAAPARKPCGYDFPYVPGAPMRAVGVGGGKYSIDGAGTIADVVRISTIGSQLGVPAASVGSDGQSHEIRGPL